MIPSPFVSADTAVVSLLGWLSAYLGIATTATVGLLTIVGQ